MWHELHNEANTFHYNKGNDRKMENYYDCIKFIGIHNLNNYQYKEVKIDGKEIKFPEIFNEITINKNNIQFKLNKIFKDKKLNLLGINSTILDNFKED